MSKKLNVAFILSMPAGFCGYEWMIDSIIRDGDIYSTIKPKPFAVQEAAQC